MSHQALIQPTDVGGIVPDQQQEHSTMKEPKEIALTELHERLSEVLGAVVYGNTEVTVTRFGRPYAVISPHRDDDDGTRDSSPSLADDETTAAIEPGATSS